MPILRFDLIEGHTEGELKTLLDAAHRAQLAAFKVPERDRFQIVHEHNRSQMIIEDRGLGIERSDKIVVVQVLASSTREQREGRVLQEPVRRAKAGVRRKPHNEFGL
jgi:Tautomerase enzyme